MNGKRLTCIGAAILAMMLVGGCAVKPAAKAISSSPSASTVKPPETAAPTAHDTIQTATPQPNDTVDVITSATVVPETVLGKAVSTGSLKLKSSASEKATTIARIPNGTTFTVTRVSENPDWLEVYFSDKFGYVPSSQVIINNKETNRVCTVTRDSANIRSGAGKQYDIVGTLMLEDTVAVTDQIQSVDGTWYKIVIGNATGYMIAQNCRVSSGR